MRRRIINFLHEKIRANLWTKVWWFVPLSAILLLPLGLIFTFLLGKIGFEGAGRLTQILILFSLIYGIVAGLFVLFLVDFARISENSISKIKWLARLAVITPLLLILTLFLIFSR